MSDPDDDLTAAEYALGTLDPDERAAATRRTASDAAFAELVFGWEQRLAPLTDAIDEIEPPRTVFAAILARLGLRDTGAPDDTLRRRVVVLDAAVIRWRRATVVISALAACLALLSVVEAFRPRTPAPTLVAVLQRAADAPAYLVRADLQDRHLSVQSINASAPAGRSYELWLIDPQAGAPKSLGVLDQSVSSHALPSGLAPDVLARATYAVTEEQAGGSPTGAPTGSPIFVGHLAASAS